ncbi:MAG: hypothetical protein JSS83_13270 [Cyanobacteria bacterium SZAS LIN-3]|nr:hypothetical protein [Cyanobacteria bacterium SZAS LIN-3]MBS2005505.1 hypothetical protein [Cyanobacteria bacterium SZAS TMP-1]
MAQTVQTGLVSQLYTGALGKTAAELCIIGDGIEALALSALYSKNSAAASAGNRAGAEDLPSIRLLGGVVPPHIEFSSLLGTIDKIVTGQIKTKHDTNVLHVADRRLRVSDRGFDPGQCLENASQVILSCPATAYGAVAAKIAPFVNESMTIALVGAPLFGAFQFDYHLRQHRPDLIVNIVEMDSLFNHAKKSSHGISLSGVRRRVNLSGRSRNETRRSMPLAAVLSPGLLPASNLLERGLLDVGAIVRPVLVLSALLGGGVDRLANIPEMLNRSNLSTLTEIERELSKLTFVYKSSLVDFTRILREEARANSNFLPARRQLMSGANPADSTTEALAEAVSAACSSWFSGLTWTHGLAIEVLSRYVGEQLVLISELGKKAAVAMPVLDSVIDLASALVGYDLRKQGRTLASCGLDRASLADLIELLNA